jgi:DNA polymerase-3 subunit delta
MPRIAAQELLTRLEKGKLVPAILLLGDEPYLRDACRAQLIQRFVPESARDWAVSRYSADRAETEAAVGQAQTVPMLSPQQIVFLEDVQAIEKLSEKNREATAELLQSYLEKPSKFTLLVLEATALDQRMKLAKLLAENALVVDVALGDNVERNIAAATALARTMAEGNQVQFEPGAAEDLAEAVAADLMRLKTEIDKLATYAGERKLIRRADVRAMVISEKAATVWELTDMLASRNRRQALEFLDRLLREGEEPIRMVGAIAWMFRKLVEASELRSPTSGYQAARALGMNPQQAELAIQAARKISQPRLLEGLRAIQRADDRLKGRAEDERTVMEFLITELTAGARSALG